MATPSGCGLTKYQDYSLVNQFNKSIAGSKQPNGATKDKNDKKYLKKDLKSLYENIYSIDELLNDMVYYEYFNYLNRSSLKNIDFKRKKFTNY